MITAQEAFFIGLCLEGFFYGLYSGIFAMYLQCPPNKSRTAIIVFYVLCLLYVLSTVTVVSDLVTLILESRIRTLSLQLQTDSLPMLFHVTIVQTTASGCCDFIAQCIIIYRCWIVWGQDIRVVIIPAFLAIAYLTTWLASVRATTFVPTTWGIPVILTSLAASMAVNTLVTGLIVFRILKVFLEVKATSVERTLGSTGGTKLRHVIFVIIESGMALFAIQMVRVMLSFQPVQSSPVFRNGLNIVIGIHQMFNGITPTIILVRVSMKLSFDDNESFKEAAGSLCFNNPPSNPSTLRRMGRSSTSMPPLERNEDICFNNPPSNPNSTPNTRMGS